MESQTTDKTGNTADDAAAYRLAMELSYFGQQGLTKAADDLLEAAGLARSHYRVLFLLKKHPGSTTSDLLALLNIKPQSLARTMGELIRTKAVEQKSEAGDRRLRQHYLTASGERIEAEVFTIQRARLERAFNDAGKSMIAGYFRTLYELSSDFTRTRLGPELETVVTSIDLQS